MNSRTVPRILEREFREANSLVEPLREFMKMLFRVVTKRSVINSQTFRYIGIYKMGV